jgi:hypothetical protein
MNRGNVDNELDRELFDAWRRGDWEAFDRAWAILHQRTYQVGVRLLGQFTDYTRRAMTSCNGCSN